MDAVLRLRGVRPDGHAHPGGTDRDRHAEHAPSGLKTVARQAPERDLAPIAQRLRVRYAKGGRLRFASHRDFQRAFERALRRAEVPIAFSVGFSPHPKISYANAVPTGVASDAEYLEIGVTRPLDPDWVRDGLDTALPDGFAVLEAVVARTPDFMERLQGSRWRFEFPGIDVGSAHSALSRLLAAERVEVQRMTKSGLRTFDARGAVMSGTATEGDTCAILTVVTRHGTPSVRPDDVLAALRLAADLVPDVPARVTRLAQGPLDSSGTVGDPLAPDRGQGSPEGYPPWTSP